MLHTILVPLDGSKQAETVLPVAARIARVHAATLLLLRVDSILDEIGVYMMPPADDLQRVVKHCLARDATYLSTIATSELFSGITVRTFTSTGPIVQAILDAAETHQCDLLIMSRHGQSNHRNRAMGRIAQSIAHASDIPVLFIHDEDQDRHTNHTIPVMVPLDGSLLAEEALVPAAQLATALAAPQQGMLHLVRVIQPVPYIFEEGAAISQTMESQTKDEARRYLTRVQRRFWSGDLSDLHVRVSTTLITACDVPHTILRAAECGETANDTLISHGCGALALATHGRSGFSRWLMGNVTECALKRCKLPLLLVRPNKHALQGQAMMTAGFATFGMVRGGDELDPGCAGI